MTTDTQFLYTAEEAALRLRTCVRTMERWRKTGSGPRFVKVGRRVAYAPKALDEWCAIQTRRHTAEHAGRSPEAA